MSKRVLIVGATGDVGQGVVRAALERGWSVFAAGRNEAKLRAMPFCRDGRVSVVVGDLSDTESAEKLMDVAGASEGGLDAVVISVNAPNDSRALLDWDGDGLEALFRSNLFTHFHGAKAAMARLRAGGVLLGVGGGTADFVRAGRAHISMAQAALRMMYRGLAKENRDAVIRQLQIVSMVNGESTRDIAEDAWLTDDEIGRHACAIMASPGEFPGPIVSLKSRAQIGVPDAPA